MPVKHEKKTLGITSPDKLGEKGHLRDLCVCFHLQGSRFFFFTLLSISLIGIGWTLLANLNELLMDLRSLRSIQTLCVFAMVWIQWLRPLRHFSLEEVQVRLAFFPRYPLKLQITLCRLNCSTQHKQHSLKHVLLCCAMDTNVAVFGMNPWFILRRSRGIDLDAFQSDAESR